MSTCPTVAVLASHDMMPGAVNRRVDAVEGDAQFAIMQRALASLGRQAEIVRWDDATVDWSRYEAAIPSFTWDYAGRPADFVAQLTAISNSTRLLNPLSIIIWNMRKHYLRELAERGARTVPTVWAEKATREIAEQAFAHYGTDRLVIKPVVGAGAWRQVLLSKGAAWPEPSTLPPGEAMIQPFLPGIQSEGEYSFLFFNGVFSHAVVKRPAKGDYRIQQSHGGSSQPYVPTDTQLADAAAVLQAIGEPLLYARVDMAPGFDGSLLLMELELIEPYLFVDQVPDLAQRFADAYAGLMLVDA